jgi:hypothetical protein
MIPTSAEFRSFVEVGASKRRPKCQMLADAQVVRVVQGNELDGAALIELWNEQAAVQSEIRTSRNEHVVGKWLGSQSAFRKASETLNRRRIVRDDPAGRFAQLLIDRTRPRTYCEWAKDMEGYVAFDSRGEEERRNWYDQANSLDSRARRLQRRLNDLIATIPDPWVSDLALALDEFHFGDPLGKASELEDTVAEVVRVMNIAAPMISKLISLTGGGSRKDGQPSIIGLNRSVQSFLSNSGEWRFPTPPVSRNDATARKRLFAWRMWHSFRNHYQKEHPAAIGHLLAMECLGDGFNGRNLLRALKGWKEAERSSRTSGGGG